VTFPADGVLCGQNVEDQVADCQQVFIVARTSRSETVLGFGTKTLDSGFGGFEVVVDFSGK